MGVSDTHEEASFLICIPLRPLRTMKKKKILARRKQASCQRGVSSGVEWRPS